MYTAILRPLTFAQICSYTENDNTILILECTFLQDIIYIFLLNKSIPITSRKQMLPKRFIRVTSTNAYFVFSPTLEIFNN